jgi:neurotransmitter:Na+ symporter, NSS family
MSDEMDRGTPEPAVSPAHAGHGDAPEFAREVWGTRLGFVLAAVGSAVGLGNMWRFPYTTAEHGGAAFVLLYILMTFLIGIPVLLAEFSIGRRTKLSPIGALRRAGGRGWTPLGYIFVATGFLILGYYSVIAGWVTRYALVGMTAGFPGDPGAFFDQVSTGGAAVGFHLAFMAIVIAIVMGGVEKGIERASVIMMPMLFLLIVGLAIWAATLPGSAQGYSYYLAPRMAELTDPATIAAAAGQAFFSLSLGMGAMLTFSSYLSRDESLPREGTVIAFSDFGVAFIAGLVAFPVIFALGLQGAVGESTVGALFISLPGAFAEMTAPLGRIVGSIFFIALFIGAVTSAVSLLEVVTSSVIDEAGIGRKPAAIGAGLIIAVLGVWPALDIDALGFMDSLASDVLLPLGGLLLAIFVGWIFKDPIGEVARGTGPVIRRILPGWLWMLRVVAPVLLLVVLWTTIPAAWTAVQEMFGR